MNARLKELLDRMVAVGPFPQISASEGHEVVNGVVEMDEKVHRLEAFLGHLHGVLVTSNPIATVNAMELAKEIEAFRKENP